MKTTICTLLCLATLAACADKQPIERYQSIIDRQMFGPLPPGFDPTKMPSEVTKSTVSEKELTQEQQKLQSAIHFSVINVTPEGVTAVGFTDNSDPKAPVHYYLKEGETRNGWFVKEADAAKASMTIVKGDIEVSLELGGNSASAGNAANAAKAAGNLSSPRRGGLLGGSLRERRLQRERQSQEAQAQAAAEAAAKEAEREAKAEAEKAQREAERAEQRQQLLAIQEELKRVRDAKAAAKSDENGGDENNADN